MSYDANSMVILFSAAIGNKRGQPSHQTFGPSYFVIINENLLFQTSKKMQIIHFP